MERRFIAANDLLLDSFRLAVDIHDAGFRPDFLVGLWRGGTAVGIAVQEGLEYLGVETDHIAVRTSYTGPESYHKRDHAVAGIRVHALQYLVDRLEAEHRLLIVDDVYSTGASVQAVINELTRKTRRNLPHDIRTATVWYRPTERTVAPPDFFIHETADWLVLPYELQDLSRDEIRANKPAAARLIEELAGKLAEKTGPA
ncbi:phosphoribosyltransferase [Lentisalinibacter salinarum]|uniref:phosphoribosyltransferase n=1 Tax=Lentisalinibacter salinarum TaxID=2992239 RepID=UPI00386C67C4